MNILVEFMFCELLQNVVSNIYMVTLLLKGFLVGSYGLTWALKNSSKISKLAILNSPLTSSSPIPGLFQQLRFCALMLPMNAPLNLMDKPILYYSFLDVSLDFSVWGFAVTKIDFELIDLQNLSRLIVN